MIAIIDYGMGNRRSVEKAFYHVGNQVFLTDDHERIQRADGLILPGVGAFPEAIGQLKKRGLIELVCERALAGVPLLGICLGMQLLFDTSNEQGETDGFHLLAGHVSQLGTRDVKLPHIGWNEIQITADCPLFTGLPKKVALYHVHSFMAVPDDSLITVGEGFYGTRFPAVVQKNNIFGVQGHPEKSSQVGLKMLENFVRYCES